MKKDDAQWWTETEDKGKYRSHLQRVCDKLSDFAVPISLVHGDLNPVNAIVSENDELKYIDFAFSCVSYPFLDALNFAHACGATKEDLGFYLKMWAECESVERLEELLTIVDDVFGVVSVLRLHKLHVNAEESGKQSAREETTLPVYSVFDE